MSKRKRWGKLNCCKMKSWAEFLPAFCPMARAVTKEVTKTSRFAPFNIYSTDLGDNQFSSFALVSEDLGPSKVCARTAWCPLEQQSTRPNGGSATVYCWWIQQPIYIHLSRNIQVEANIMVMFICFWLQNVCKCICKLSASIRLMAKCQTIP